MDPEALYRQLGQLVSVIPSDLAGQGAISEETHRWLGRAAALLAETVRDLDALGMADQIAFTSAVDGLQSILRTQNAHQIIAILHRALARAERNAPAAVQGAFITVGAQFDVLQVVAKVLEEARRDIFVVDPYMDAKVLTDFAPLAAERVAVRLLSDSHCTRQDALRAPATRWINQHGNVRPLEVRFTAPRLLHDRLILVDGGARVWSLTQSLKDFAARSPGSILRVDDRDLANMKRDAYEHLWANAQPL